MKIKIKRIDLTYDQGKERQARWKKICANEQHLSTLDITDTELLNWISMNFHVVRKLSNIEEI